MADKNITVTTETHPYTATVTGRFVYSDTNGEEIGSVPVSVTIGDNCCEEHAEMAAHGVLTDAAKRRNGREIPFGLAVRFEVD